MSVPLPAEVLAEETPNGSRYLLPAYESLPGRRRRSTTWFAIGGLMLVVGLVLWSSVVINGRNPTATGLGFASMLFGVLIGVVGWSMRVARCRVDLTATDLRFGERMVTWIERILPRSQTSGFYYYTFRSDGVKPAGSGVIRIECEGRPPIWFAAGYPPELLRPFGKFLAERAGTAWEESDEDPTPEYRVFTLPPTVSDEFLNDVLEQPPGGSIQIERTAEGLRIAAPPLPFGKDEMAKQFVAPAVILGIIGLISLFVVMKDPKLKPTSFLIPVGFGAISGLLATIAIRKNRRLLALVAEPGQLQIIRSKLWSSALDVRPIAFTDIKVIRVGRCIYSPKGAVWPELQITTNDNKTVGILVGRDKAELLWLATLLRRTYSVPALE